MLTKAFSKEKWKYLLYTLSHPVDGFYWIRHSEKGSLPIAFILVLLFSASFSANRLLAGFVVNDIDPRTVDSLYEFIGVLAFYILLCVSNWSVTCLTGGEGRMKDILTAVGYGTMPITIGLVLSTVVSRFVADEEQAFYSIILGVCVAWGIIMIIIGIMQIHNFSAGKTLVTLILTFAAMLIIVFILLLLSNLIGKVYNFFRSIYTEIIFRT
jgi:hypothetical protein